MGWIDGAVGVAICHHNEWGRILIVSCVGVRGLFEFQDQPLPTKTAMIPPHIQYPTRPQHAAFPYVSLTFAPSSPRPFVAPSSPPRRPVWLPCVTALSATAGECAWLGHIRCPPAQPRPGECGLPPHLRLLRSRWHGRHLPTSRSGRHIRDVTPPTHTYIRHIRDVTPHISEMCHVRCLSEM